MPDRTLVLAPIGPFAFAIDAELVEQVADEGDVEGPRRDLAALLGLDPPTGRRRALRVAGRSWLIVGERIEIRILRNANLQAIPAWLASVASRAPIRALIALEQDEGPSFACQLDASRLFAPPSPEQAGGCF
ncbi:MAG: hypothetical protein K8H88_12320 [Sandaracinaceae bacterium]|nr:hypothetical protein [Sandaracinaceae bacterium]